MSACTDTDNKNNCQKKKNLSKAVLPHLSITAPSGA